MAAKIFHTKEKLTHLSRCLRPRHDEVAGADGTDGARVDPDVVVGGLAEVAGLRERRELGNRIHDERH